MKLGGINTLLTRKMNRKEFLITVGVIVVTLTGILGIYKNISGFTYPKTERGFGSGPYGK